MVTTISGIDKARCKFKMDTERIYWDTPISELQHSDSGLAYIDLNEGELMHWKYIKREKLPNGKWRYYYDKDALKNDSKKLFSKATDSVLNKANQSAGRVNSFVDKAKAALGKWYNNASNVYDVNRYNYAEKLKQVKASKEWQDIVARKDSEYVKKNKDGSTTYLIDDYLVDKKHPVLDAIGDIMSGRKVTINKIDKDTVVAGIKDYVNTGLELGMLSVSFLTNGLTKKFKYSQGSYDEDVERLIATAELGASYVESVVGEAASATDRVYNGESASDIVSDVLAKTATKVASGVSKEDVAKLAEMVATAGNVVSSVRDENVVEAAQVLVESDLIKSVVGENEYYKQAENALQGLSEEEIMLLNLLIQQMRT